MASFNRVILLGNLTRDPQLKHLPNDLTVCEFGLAISQKRRDRVGNQREEVCFVDCTAFGRQAETVHKYCAKGQPLLIEGRLKYESWTGRDGQKRSKLSVVLEGFQFVGGPPRGGTHEASRPAADPTPALVEADRPAPTGDEIPF
jgi:single-strand DNA-binding protein